MVAVGPAAVLTGIGRYADTLADGGWPSDAVRARFHAWIRDPGMAACHPGVARYAAVPGPAVTRTRRPLVPDRDWDTSAFVNDELRAHGFDDGILSRCPTAAGVAYMRTVMGAAGAKPFTDRAGNLVDRVRAELAPPLARGLWLTTQPHVGTLPPRRRQVLDALLEGDSEKQAAAKLGLHVTTVHDHVKALYRHFGVASRAELLAAFLRRHRPAG